jgi:hypothetical protein
LSMSMAGMRYSSSVDSCGAGRRDSTM